MTIDDGKIQRAAKVCAIGGAGDSLLTKPSRPKGRRVPAKSVLQKKRTVRTHRCVKPRKSNRVNRRGRVLWVGERAMAKKSVMLACGIRNQTLSSSQRLRKCGPRSSELCETLRVWGVGPRVGQRRMHHVVSSSMQRIRPT